MPAQTIGANTLAALRPLRTVGVGRAVQATLSQDGALVAVATTAGVALLELPAMRLAQFFALPGGVEAVALSPNGERVALRRSNPETVELRRVSDGAVLGSAPGASMAFSHDGALFAGGADTRTDPSNQLILLRSADGAKVATLAGADTTFSPNSKTIATTVVGDGNVSTRLQRADGGEIGFIQGGDARFSPDGQLVAATVFPLDGSTPQTGIYRAVSAEPAFAADGSLPTFSPDGRTLAVAKAREVVLYSIPDGKQLAALQPDSVDPNVYGNPDVLAIAFSADGATLRAVVGGDLYAWGVANGKRLNIFTGLAQRGGQPDAAFGPRGESLISRSVIGDADCGLYSGLRVLNAADGSELAADTQGVDAQFSADGKLAVIVSSLGTVRVVPLGDTESDMVASLPGYGAIAFSPEGATLAASQVRNGNNPFGPSAVDLYDVAGGALKTSLAVDSYVGEPTSLRFGDPNTLFAEEESGCDFVYEVKQTAWDLRAGGVGRALWKAPEVESEPYPQAASVRAFNALTSTGAWADAAGVVRVATEGVTITLTLPAPATALAFSLSGLLAVGYSGGTVQLLDLKEGDVIQPRAVSPSQEELSVTQLAFSPDGTMVAARSTNGQIRLWRASAQEPIATLAAATDDQQLLITPDNQLLVSAGPTGVSFYSLTDGHKLQTLDVVASKVAMGPGRRLIAVLSDERVTLWGVQ